jgi:hypothetical protein
MKLAPFAAIIFAATASQCLAHEVWIEDTPEGRLVARFAEYGDDFEKSPGALDSLSLPAAFVFGDKGKSSSVATEKKNDHFLIAGAVAKTAAHVETTFNVMGGGDKPARKPVFYARWQPAEGGAAQPALTFDLVPTGKPGEACVYFRGQPQPGAKATAYLPSGETKDLTADAGGVVRVEADAPGLYLIACKHQREAQNGFWNGRAYDTVSHNCSLAWRVAARTP